MEAFQSLCLVPYPYIYRYFQYSIFWNDGPERLVQAISNGQGDTSQYLEF